MSAALVDWERYPENLPTDDGESIWHDLGDYNLQILSDSKRLFVEHEDEIAVKVFDFSARGAHTLREAFLKSENYAHISPCRTRENLPRRRLVLFVS